MKIYYHHGFYFADEIPQGAFELSESDYLALLNGQAKGSKIATRDNGEPYLIPKRPSVAHKWDGENWILCEELAKAQFIAEKSRCLTELAAKADALKSALLIGYPQTEIDAFYRQEKEALLWRENPEMSRAEAAPMLTQIAENRGIPFEILAQKVLEKADIFAEKIGVIIGQRQKFEDELNQAETLDAVQQLRQRVQNWTIAAV